MEYVVLLVLLSLKAVFVECQSDLKHGNLKQNSAKFSCPGYELTDPEGIISSPFYPNTYPSHLSCSWYILGQTGDLITVKFLDLDIEGTSCKDQSCCVYNWLKIGPLLNGSEAKICGKDGTYHRTFLSSTNKLTIKFQISRFTHGGRGFSFRYKIVPQTSGNCKGNEFVCGNKKCIPSTLRCNSGIECEDGSDEMHCSNHCASGRSCLSSFQCYEEAKHCNGIVDCTDFSDEYDCSFCYPNQTWCGQNSSQCYDPIKQRCDRIFDCLNGADEMDCYSVCPGKLMCDSRGGCYTMNERCNGITQCEDASDEKRCIPEMCNMLRGGFLCDNKRCIQQAWTCDRTDDCGDGSDEKDCLRNSVLTAAIMGSLICALLLVIAISCTCRLHALRMMEGRMQNQSHETSLTRMMTQEFFFREPPPSYAVAVQGDPACRNQYCGRRSGRPRRPRHGRSSRRPPPRMGLPPPIPPTELLDDTTVTLATMNELPEIRQPAKTEENVDSTSNFENGSNKSSRTTTSDQCRRTGDPNQIASENMTLVSNDTVDVNSDRITCTVEESANLPCSDDIVDEISTTSSVASQTSSSRITDCSSLVINGQNDAHVQESYFYCDSETDPLVE